MPGKRRNCKAWPPGCRAGLQDAAVARIVRRAPPPCPSRFPRPPGRSPAVRRLAALLEPMDEATPGAARGGIGRSDAAALSASTIRLFAPLYLSNECINSCTYCGFSRENAILRVTLSREAMLREARHLAAEGFRQILLVAGEHPKFVSSGYLEECVRALAAEIPGIALEVAPMETAEYARLVAAGAEGLLVYQETYDPETYAELHRGGAEEGFCLAARLPGAGVRGRLSQDRARRALRSAI